jgi:hypothetical protein
MQFFNSVSSRAELEEQGAHIVTPERAIEMIRRYQADNKITRFYTWAVPPGLPPSWSDEHIELMASEVIPAFR